MNREDIIEVKPGLWGVHLNVNALLRSIGKKPVLRITDTVVQRFFQIFRDHGVPETQIPRLVPEISLENLSSDEKLLRALTPDVLSKVSKLFQIRQRWLEGVGETIYDCHYAYKTPERFFEQLETLQLGGFLNPVIAFTSTENLSNKTEKDQYVVLVMLDRCAEIDGQDLYRYRIFDDEWNWGYWKTRVQLKAMVRLVDRKIGTPVPIYKVEKKELEAISNGKVVPKTFMRNRLRSKSVSLEDYAESYEENRQAKEIEELPHVLEYIKENRLEDYKFPTFT